MCSGARLEEEHAELSRTPNACIARWFLTFGSKEFVLDVETTRSAAFSATQLESGVRP
jgi:hypothetical protein